MQTCYVYILACADGTHYTGITAHLITRMLAHQLGAVSYTRHRKPLTVLVLIPMPTRKAAATLERSIKKTGAARWLRRHHTHVKFLVERLPYQLTPGRYPGLGPEGRRLAALQG